MTNQAIRWCGWAALGLLAAGSLPAQTGRDSAPAMPDPYQVVLKRSIFSRERPSASRAPRDFSPSSFRPPVAREDSPVLRGVIQDETGLLAFLENPRSGKMMLVEVGQQLGQGVVEEITLDYLLLRPAGGGEARRIDVGAALTGEMRSVPAAAAVGTPIEGASTTQPASPGGESVSTGGSAPAPSAPGATPTTLPTDPKERLRLRRLKELGQ